MPFPAEFVRSCYRPHRKFSSVITNSFFRGFKIDDNWRWRITMTFAIHRTALLPEGTTHAVFHVRGFQALERRSATIDANWPEWEAQLR